MSTTNLRFLLVVAHRSFAAQEMKRSARGHLRFALLAQRPEWPLSLEPLGNETHVFHAINDAVRLRLVPLKSKLFIDGGRDLRSAQVAALTKHGLDAREVGRRAREAL